MAEHSHGWQALANHHMLIGHDGQSRGQRALAGGVLDFAHLDTAVYIGIYEIQMLHMSKYNEIYFFSIHYVKPTSQMLFKSRFPKSGPTYRRQVVDP